MAAAAEAELHDDTALREQLLDAQMRFELGELSAREFRVVERDILAAIREMKGQQPGALSMSPTDGVTGVDIESFDSER